MKGTFFFFEKVKQGNALKYGIRDRAPVCMEGQLLLLQYRVSNLRTIYFLTGYVFAVEDCPMHCRMFISMFDLFLLSRCQ